MDETQILQAVKAELNRAEAFIDSKIATERAAAYDYFYGRPFGWEQDGRSQIVSADVAQSIGSALPALLKIFVGGDKAVELTPRGPEDVEAAEQATIGANYVFFTQNNGYALAHDFIFDGLIAKTGIFKWKWDEKEVPVEKTFQGLDDMSMQMLAQQVEQQKGEIIQHSEYPGPMGLAHDVKVRFTKKEGKVKITVPAPEEILISPDAEGLDVMEMPFIAHKCVLTRADLIGMGYKASQVDELPSGDDEDDFVSEDRDSTEGEGDYERPVKTYVYNECYAKLATGKGGTDELHNICIVGNTILHDEVIDHIPMAIWTPKVMPHEVIGVSLADEVMDIQLLKSTLWRAALDNAYLSIAPRLFVQGDVNLDDVLTVKPGGIIRGEANSAVTPIVVPSLMGDAFQLMEYADQEEEVRTGISRLFQGIDPQAINKTATGVNALINQANARVELMARNAAEHGFKPLFKGILYLLSKHQPEQLMVRLNNTFTPIDPETWSKEYDMSVNVGLGTGTKEQQLQQLMMLGQMIQGIGGTPFAGQLLDAKKVFNLTQKIAELSGYKDVTKFLNDPEGTEPPPPAKPPEVQVAEIEAQTSMQKAQMEMQGSEQEMQQKSQLEQQKMVQEAELEKYKADLKAQTEVEIAKIKAVFEQERELQRCTMEHERGLKDIEARGRPGAVISVDDAEGSIGEVANHLRGQGEGMAQAMAMLSEAMALQAQAATDTRNAMAGIAEAMSRPKQIIRGKDGRAVGVA